MHPGDDLETAQLNKKRHIASKLLMGSGDLNVLDIGSGWGGLGIYLASVSDSRVTGVTLSTEQHKVSTNASVPPDFRIGSSFTY